MKTQVLSRKCMGLSLANTSGCESKCRNKMGRDLAQRPMILRRRPTAKGVGLRVADSHTGNHLEDGFTLLETIRRLLVIIGRRSHSGFKGEAFEPERRLRVEGSIAGSVLVNTELPKMFEEPEVSDYRVIEILSALVVHDLAPVTMSPVVLVHTFTDMAQLEADNSDVVHDMDNENVNIHQVGAQTATVKSPGNNDVGASNVMAWIYNFDYMWTDMGVFNIWERRLKWSFDLLNSLKKETTFIHLNLIPELHIVHSETISNYIKKETTPKCKTRGGSSRPLVKRKLAFRSSSSRVVRTKTSASKDDTPIVSISEDDEGKFSVHLVLSEGIDLLIHPLSSLYVLLGLPNCFELKDANACHLKISAITPPTWKVNKRAREFLQVIEKMSGEADVIKARILVLALREKISSLTIDVKEHKGNLDRMMLKSQKWAGYQVTLLTLKSKVDSIKAEKAKLEAVEVSLLREVEELKQDRRDVVSKVIPYAAMKEPFDLSKAKGYRSSYKKEHTQTSNDFATATFPWLDEFVAGLNPSVFSWP
ncbi:hypothetical protein Tco_0701482 [Tanacetum coccineum]